MIHYLNGRISMRFDGGLVVEAGNVGFRVFVPDNSPLYHDAGKGDIRIYIAMIVREDDISLYGFPDEESLSMFQRLRTVNGVGAKAALAVLSAMPLEDVIKSILYEDVASLSKAYGIGKKTAQRIVLELKDKLDDIGIGNQLSGKGNNIDSCRIEAINALIELGYSRSEAERALADIHDDSLTTEEYIKKALQGAGQHGA